MYRGSSSLSCGTVQVRSVWFIPPHPGCCHPARSPAGIRQAWPHHHWSCHGDHTGPEPPMHAVGPSSTGGHFLRVCCLRACSRWRAPVLDPAPMEKAGVDEPGSRKVAQVSAASLRAGTRGSVIPIPGGMEGFASPGAQQVPPQLAPRAQPGPSIIPSPRGQHDPSAPQR